MKIKLVLIAVCLLFAGSVSFAQTKKAVVTAAEPEQVVKNLYAARKNPKTDPFFQKKNRALLDKYFSKNLADIIWKDAVATTDGVGALDFDPLYYAQDVRITNFVVGKADNNNVVRVRFKDMGKDEEIAYTLVKENTESKEWKIDTIMYSDAEDLGSIIEDGMMTEAERTEAAGKDKLSGDYLVGTVKCNIAVNKSGYYARVKCDDQPNFQVIDTESLTFGAFNPNEKGRKGKFVSAADGSISEFVETSGKKTKVTRIK